MAADVALEKCSVEGMFFDLSAEHKSDMFEKFCNLRKERILCDVTLHLGNKQIKAHKILLASSIPYFHSMFTHDLVESRQNNITLKDMDPDSVGIIIDFIYTSKLYISQKNVQTLLHVATILQVTLVQEKCCEFLEKQLDVTNCLGIFAYAEMHGCLNLKFKAKNFCDRNFRKVIREDEFLSLPFERVRWFLDQNELCVRTEAEVVDAVYFWIRHSQQDRKSRLASLLSLVRLHLLSRNYLQNLIETCSLIKADTNAMSIIINVLKDLDGKIVPVSKRVPLGLEVIFFMGGYNKRSYASYDCFNPENGEWRNLGEMPKPKSGAGAVFLGGLLYMIGGHTNSSNDKRDSDTAESYDPFTNEWNVVAKLNTPRHRLGVAVLDGMIYAVGGSDGMIHLNSIERYDIETDTWTTLPNMVTRRMGVGVAVLNGLLYAVGGFDSENRLRTVECYCPTKDRWKFVQSMNTPRSGAGVVALNGHVYALGGYNGVAQLNSVERYCPIEDRWTMIAPMNEHRSALSVAVVKNKLFALGGYNGAKFLNSVEVYEPDSGEWQLLNSMPEARSGAGAAVGTIPIEACNNLITDSNRTTNLDLT